MSRIRTVPAAVASFALLCALLFTLQAARSATIIVNSAADIVANDGQCTLRARR